MTPMHLVAQKGDADLLTEFLLVCPDSIRDANINGETALHITVINNRYEELKVLTGWMQRMRSRDALSNEIHIQNKSGMTALDALRANGPHMDMAIEKVLQKAGGKCTASISKFKTNSVFLREPVTFKEYCFTGMARYRSRMSDGTQNSLLVITALIITATYQTAAQSQDKDRVDDLTTGEIILEIVLLWGLNTIAFLLAIVLTFILLPVGRAYMWWYVYISVPLVCSYAISVYLKYILPLIFFSVYVMVLFGFLIYLLVFYVKWKRTTQKKVPNPKTELISDGFNTIV